VLDEPTNGLDVMAIRNLREMLQRLRGQGRCILFSSHVMQEVAALCDRVVIIGHGRLLADDTPQAIRERTGSASLEEAFLQVLGARAESLMRALLIVFAKEFVENLRDRRTLISALLFGPLFGPLLFGAMVSRMLNQKHLRGGRAAAADDFRQRTRAGTHSI
jgi:ABC-type multidrug transport system ATPase subunit